MITKSYTCPETLVETEIMKVTNISYSPLSDKTSFSFGAFVSESAPSPIQSWTVNDQEGSLSESACETIIDGMVF